MNCVTCQANCDRAGTYCVTRDCISYTPKDYPKPLTNADLIRSMTNNELAIFLYDIQNQNIPYEPIIVDDCKDCRVDACYLCLYEWLKQEVAE